MATTLYPRATQIPTARFSSSWGSAIGYFDFLLTRGSPSTNAVFGQSTEASLSTTSASGTISGWGSTTTITVASLEAWASAGSGTRVYITNPLNAVTIAGTITVNARALESSTMANYGCAAFVYRIAAGNGVATKIGAGHNTTELSTSETASSISITPTSTALSDGDMLGLVFAWIAAGGTSASGFTVTGLINGPTAGASGDAFATFTETITEQTVAADVFPPFLGGGYYWMGKGWWGKQKDKIWKPEPRLWVPEKPQVVLALA